MATTKAYPDDVAAMKTACPELALDVASFTGIAHILDWMKQRSLTTIDMIGQDEFEYDFMVQLADGSWLVFGVT